MQNKLLLWLLDVFLPIHFWLKEQCLDNFGNIFPTESGKSKNNFAHFYLIILIHKTNNHFKKVSLLPELFLSLRFSPFWKKSAIYFLQSIDSQGNICTFLLHPSTTQNKEPFEKLLLWLPEQFWHVFHHFWSKKSYFCDQISTIF
jgi:hypothetical protein